MPDVPLGVGIVGTGLSASQHCAALRNVTNGRPVAVTGTSIEKARLFAASWNIASAVASIDDLVAHRDVEIVHACVPPGARMVVVAACARERKPVLLEKPIARSIGEADAILKLAEDAGITIGAMFQNRFTPLAKRLRSLVRDGDLGRPILVEVSAKWYRDADYYRRSGWRGTREHEGGAVLINQAIHIIDLMQWVVGPVSAVGGIAATQLHPIEMEDTAVATLRFANGAIGSLVAATTAWPGFSDRMDIHGSDGWARLVQSEGRLEWQTRGMDAPRQESAVSQVSGAGRDPAATPTQGHSSQFEELYDAIRAGRRPAIDGREGRHALAIVEAIHRASETGTEIRLETP